MNGDESRVRVLIADDHPVVRSGLVSILESQPNFDVVGEAEDGGEAISLAGKLSPDVILMDLRMPNMDGVSAIKAIISENPEAKILVLTTYDSDADILRAVEAGATGYLLKDSSRKNLFAAVRATASGRTLLAPKVADSLMKSIRTPKQRHLSDRETEVLELARQGLVNREIGRKLHVSEATVKTHLIHAFEKLGVPDRTSAVSEALKRGYLKL